MTVPPHWRWSFLGKVVEINRSSLSEDCDPERSFFYLDLASVENWKVSFPKEPLKFRDAPSRARRLFEKNDVLMATVGSNYPALNSTQVAELKLLIPPVEEQKHITAILGTWDRAIEKLQALVTAKTERKRGLMQKLLTGQIRVKT